MEQALGIWLGRGPNQFEPPNNRLGVSREYIGTNGGQVFMVIPTTNRVQLTWRFFGHGLDGTARNLWKDSSSSSRSRVLGHPTLGLFDPWWWCRTDCTQDGRDIPKTVRQSSNLAHGRLGSLVILQRMQGKLGGSGQPWLDEAMLLCVTHTATAVVTIVSCLSKKEPGCSHGWRRSHGHHHGCRWRCFSSRL